MSLLPFPVLNFCFHGRNFVFSAGDLTTAPGNIFICSPSLSLTTSATEAVGPGQWQRRTTGDVGKIGRRWKPLDSTSP